MTPLFSLPMQFVVPDILLADEYLSLDEAQLTALGLKVLTLDGDLVIQVATLRRQHPQPSTYDLSAYILARALGAVLLTGDGSLRQLAQRTKVPCHGTLWLLDQIVWHKTATEIKAAMALERMLQNESRLPQDECNDRLRRWRSR